MIGQTLMLLLAAGCSIGSPAEEDVPISRRTLVDISYLETPCITSTTEGVEVTYQLKTVGPGGMGGVRSETEPWGPLWVSFMMRGCPSKRNLVALAVSPLRTARLEYILELHGTQIDERLERPYDAIAGEIEIEPNELGSSEPLALRLTSPDPRCRAILQIPRRHVEALRSREERENSTMRASIRPVS